MFALWNPAPGPHMAGPSEQPILVPIDDQPIEEDVVDLLDDNEALELVEYDPSVSTPTTWTPSKAMISFLKKHFNRYVDDSERDKTLNDFPKPNAPVLNVPKLDEEVAEQLKGKGRDPYFGQEKILYRLQESLLDVSGPLMCLWADLTNPHAEVSRKETLLLIQRALILLGSASNANKPGEEEDRLGQDKSKTEGSSH